MLTEKAFSRLYLRTVGVIHRRCKNYGFRGEELRQMVQEVALTIWKKRESWPEHLDHETAYVAAFADNIAMDAQRKTVAKKRKKNVVDDWDTPQLTQPSWRPGRTITEFGDDIVLPEQEDRLSNRSLKNALHTLADAVDDEEHRTAIRLRLQDDEPSISGLFGPHGGHEALRALRRVAEVPVEDPAAAGIRDQHQYVLDAAERVKRRAAIAAAAAAAAAAVVAEDKAKEVSSCASVSSSALLLPPSAPSEVKKPVATFPARTQRRQKTSGTPAASASATPAPAITASKSLRPSNAFARSPRPAPSATTSGGSATSASAPSFARRDGPSPPNEPAPGSATTDALLDEEPSFGSDQ